MHGLTNNLMKSAWGLICLCTIVLICKADDDVKEEEDVKKKDVDEDEEEGDVEEDLTKFTKDELVMFKILWKLRDCAGPADEKDNVTMIM